MVLSRISLKAVGWGNSDWHGHRHFPSDSGVKSDWSNYSDSNLSGSAMAIFQKEMLQSSASELVNISVPRNISSNFGAGISLCYSHGGDFSEGHGGRNSLLLLLWVSGCYVQEFRTWVIHLSWIWGLALTNCVLWYGWLKLLLALLLQSWSLTHNLEHVADFVVNINTRPTHCYLFVFLKLSLFTKD